MKRSDIRNIIMQEIANLKKEAAGRAVKRGTVTDNARLAMILTSLGKRAKGAFQKRKVVSQVILHLTKFYVHIWIIKRMQKVMHLLK